MKFQITKNQNVYEIKGRLISRNIEKLNQRIGQLLGKSTVIMVSLDKVNEIDEKGVRAMIAMYRKAMTKDTVLYILGKKNQKVYDMFEAQKKHFVLHELVLSVTC